MHIHLLYIYTYAYQRRKYTRLSKLIMHTYIHTYVYISMLAEKYNCLAQISSKRIMHTYIYYIHTYMHACIHKYTHYIHYIYTHIHTSGENITVLHRFPVNWLYLHPQNSLSVALFKGESPMHVHVHVCVYAYVLACIHKLIVSPKRGTFQRRVSSVCVCACACVCKCMHTQIDRNST
jgi:hypothetical protein